MTAAVVGAGAGARQGQEVPDGVAVPSPPVLSSTEFRRLVGATRRQMDYWSSHGVFGDEYVAPGSGCRRLMPASLVEAGHAAVATAALAGYLSDRGGHFPVLAAVVSVVRERPVVPGEWLAVGEGWVTRNRVAEPSEPHLIVPLLTAAEIGAPR